MTGWSSRSTAQKTRPKSDSSIRTRDDGCVGYHRAFAEIRRTPTVINLAIAERRARTDRATRTAAAVRDGRPGQGVDRAAADELARDLAELADAYLAVDGPAEPCPPAAGGRHPVGA
ncbi:hypothetical protein [Kitasatospora sp. NPDC098663]|uniref:hypothetical protein n=1 Tax=Kitasatospora sp. NPDC098663 TaxID=3364096 RepID=UPI00382F5637